MLSITEIATKRFDKSIGGYRVEEVDRFLAQLAEEVGRLIQDKDDLERKLEVLAEKLIEYREDEESLRTALLGAQKLGDSVIRESRTKAEIILRDATIKAERLAEDAQRQIEHERQGLVTLQSEVAGFKNRLLGLYKQHLELVSALPGEFEGDAPREDEAPAGGGVLEAAEAGPEWVAEAPADALLPEDDMLPFDAAPAAVPAEGDDDAGESLDAVFAAAAPPAGESKFGELHFGEGYELSRDDRKKRR